MELRHIRTLLAVAQHRTVHAAALELGTAPSSVSERIRQLEAELGIELFTRSRDGMRLTPLGVTFHDSTQAAMAIIDAAVTAARNTVAPLRVGALESIAATVLPPLLDAHAERHPRAPIELHVDADRAELLAALASGKLDAVVLLDTGERLGDLGFDAPSVPLEHLDLADVPLVLVAAPGTALDPDDLAQTTMLGNGTRCSFWMATRQWLGQRPIEALGSLGLVKEWAAQGRGVALLPDYAVRAELAERRLEAIKIQTPSLKLRLAWTVADEARPDVRSLLYTLAS